MPSRSGRNSANSDHPSIDHDQAVTGATRKRLRGFFARIERIEAEIREMQSDKALIFQEAKSNGFDTTVMKIVLKRRRQDREVVNLTDALVETYERAAADESVNDAQVATADAA